MEEKRVRRIFTPEQKFEILKDIERCRTIKEGLEKHQLHVLLFLVILVSYPLFSIRGLSA
jgi:hypothetical protein